MTGAEIRALREARGLTQAQLAHAIDVSAQTVTAWERHGSPTQRRPRRWQALVEYFGLPEWRRSPHRSLAETLNVDKIIAECAPPPPPPQPPPDRVISLPMLPKVVYTRPEPSSAELTAALEEILAEDLPFPELDTAGPEHRAFVRAVVRAA